MDFFLGMLSGIALSTLSVATLAYFRSEVERRVTVVEKMLYNAGPRPKGFIIEPEDEAEVARREHIRRNAEQGRDTPVSELQDEN